MLQRLTSFGRLALGLCCGGLVVGAAEALYRQVPVPYAALLYGTMWALGGLGLCLLLAVMWRRPLSYQLTWGLLLSISASALVLVRFIVVRDILHEAPGAGIRGLLAGLGAAAVCAVVVGAIGRWFGHRLRSAADKPWPWVLPLVVILGFTAMTRTADDPLPSKLPPAKPVAGHGVILIVVDTLRADAIGAYGAGPHRGAPATPNIDAFARQGLLFQDESAQASWTRPAVSSIMTSRHVSGHDTMSKVAVLPHSLPTIASVLQKAGVRTGAVVTNFNLEQGYGFDHGFDVFHYLAPARYLGAPKRANRLAAYDVYRLLRERIFTSDRQSRYFYRSGNVVNAVGMQVLNKIGQGPFFLWLHYMEPHDPYFADDGKSYARVSTLHPPESWAGRMHQAYGDEVRRFDTYFGQLLAALDARGLTDRTTIVLTADHGEEFGEHGGFYHGDTLYEEQLHVPLIMRGPGIAPGVDTQLAREIDIAPTIVGRFGVTPPKSWEGRDLFGKGPRSKISVAEENHEGNILSSIREMGTGHSLKLILANPHNPRGLKPQELYDLKTDPGEHAPLAGRPSTVAQLKKTLAAVKAQSKKGGATATTRQLDAAATSELRSLGYVQ